MTIKFTSALGRLKHRYLLLAVLMVAGLTFGTMFVCGREATEEVEIICPEPIYIIRDESDWDAYPQSLIDRCPRIFQNEIPLEFEDDE